MRERLGSKHTSLALVPVHNQWPLERVTVSLQSPDRICLVLCALDDLVYIARSTQVVQDILELVSCWRLFCNVELELGSLCLVLRIVGAGLVFGGGRNRLCICLLENGVCTQGRQAGGLVEEGNDVLHAVLHIG